MALNTFVGSFTVPLTTGNQAQTGVGFQPKAMIFWGNGRSSNGASSNGALNAEMPPYYGIAVSSSSRMVMSCDDDASSGSAVSSEDTTKCLKLIEIGVTKFAADFVSMDADGFTVNFTTGFATADVVNYMALGGSDLTNVFIKSVASPAGTGNQASTGVGFKPDALILFGQAGSNIHLTIGFGVSSTQRAFSHTAYDGSVTGRYQRTAKVFGTAAPAGSVVTREADLVSLDSDGFTLNWTTAATGQNLYVLCLKGGQYHVGSFTQKTSTGSQATTGVGFMPTGLLLSHAHMTANTTVQITIIALMLGAASSSSARAAVDYSSGSFGVAELTRSNIYTSRADDGTPTLQGQADLTSFDSDGFTLNYGTADATAREIIYFAFGSTAAAGDAQEWMTRSAAQQGPRVRNVMY